MQRPITTTHFYNPYSLPYVAILDQQTQSDFVSSAGRENSVSYNNWDIITEVDIQSQINDPITSFSIIITLGSLLVASVILIQMKTLEMLRFEHTINTRMMVTQAKLHMIFWPSSLVLYSLTDNIYPLSALTSPAFCTLMYAYLAFGFTAMILFSFYAALVRYLCLVQGEILEKFGKSKIISLIYWVFYAQSFIWTLYCVFTDPTGGRFPWVSSCYGWKDRVFLLEPSTYDALLRQAGLLETHNGKALSNIIQDGTARTNMKFPWYMLFTYLYCFCFRKDGYIGSSVMFC